LVVLRLGFALLLFTVATRLEIGLVLFVLDDLTACKLFFALRVAFILRDALTFKGAVQVLAFATMRPFLGPVEQRYLRVILLPLLPKMVVVSSIMLKNSLTNIYLFNALNLRLAGFTRLVLFAFRAIRFPSLAFVFLRVNLALTLGAA
jgi:hypothetical protein